LGPKHWNLAAMIFRVVANNPRPLFAVSPEGVIEYV
jgi:hypothetical protein